MKKGIKEGDRNKYRLSPMREVLVSRTDPLGGGYTETYDSIINGTGKDISFPLSRVVKSSSPSESYGKELELGTKNVMLER